MDDQINDDEDDDDVTTRNAIKSDRKVKRRDDHV